MVQNLRKSCGIGPGRLSLADERMEMGRDVNKFANVLTDFEISYAESRIMMQTSESEH
jgi:hypothetical protein